VLARYIVSKSQFSAENRRVKHNAFMPPAGLHLSVFVISGLAEAIVWEIGAANVAGPQGKTLYARADVQVETVRMAKLRVEVDNNPVRHANIAGWPDEKSAQMLKATILAEAAALQLHP